jgi:hypothetical protein
MLLARHKNILFAHEAPDANAPVPKEGAASDQACVPNISRAEGRKRLAGGVIMFAISLGILAALIATGVDRWWRLPLFLTFWGAAGGFFQWRDKT